MEKLESLNQEKPRGSTMETGEQDETQSTKEWREIGFKDGVLAAQNAAMTPLEVKAVEESYNEWKVSSGDANAASESVDRDVFKKWMAKDSVTYKQHHPDFNQNAYVAGWMEGVLSGLKKRNESN